MDNMVSCTSQDGLRVTGLLPAAVDTDILFYLRGSAAKIIITTIKNMMVWNTLNLPRPLHVYRDHTLHDRTECCQLQWIERWDYFAGILVV